MEAPNINPSPKARFIAYKPFVDAHRELIPKPELQRAIDYSLLEMSHQLASITDGTNAGANQFKLVGAQEFVRILKTLAEQPIIWKRMTSERELDHNV